MYCRSLHARKFLSLFNWMVIKTLKYHWTRKIKVAYKEIKHRTRQSSCEICFLFFPPHPSDVQWYMYVCTKHELSMLMSHDWRASFCCQVHCNQPQLDMSSALKGLFKWCFCVEVPHVLWFAEVLTSLVPWRDSSQLRRSFSFCRFPAVCHNHSLCCDGTFSFEWILIFMQANHEDRYSCDCTLKKKKIKFRSHWVWILLL